jgi:hypothetical protein
VKYFVLVHCFFSLLKSHRVFLALNQSIATLPDTMSEKAPESTEADYTSHTENEKAAQTLKPEQVDGPVRRKSAALNIVENPLKVSFASQPTILTLTLFTLTAQLQRADRCQCPSLCGV